MSGAPGDELESLVTITPAEKYSFSILDLKQKYNKNITATLVKPQGKERAWKIRIKSNSQTVQDLYEVITLKTDSKYRPDLRIRVYAIYKDQKSKKS